MTNVLVIGRRHREARQRQRSHDREVARTMSVAFAQTSVTRTYGRITIVASVTPTGYAINVFTGAVRHDTLCHTSTDRDTYRNHYRRVAEAAAADARGGAVYRGGKPGQAPVGVLTALARKGWLELTAKEGTRRSNWAYGTITEAGRVELARLDARSLATT